MRNPTERLTTGKLVATRMIGAIAIALIVALAVVLSATDLESCTAGVERFVAVFLFVLPLADVAFAHEGQRPKDFPSPVMSVVFQLYLRCCVILSYMLALLVLFLGSALLSLISEAHNHQIAVALPCIAALLVLVGLELVVFGDYAFRSWDWWKKHPTMI